MCPCGPPPKKHSFEQRGFTLKGLKLMNVQRSQAETHYQDLSAKPFFMALVDYIIRWVHR